MEIFVLYLFGLSLMHFFYFMMIEWIFLDCYIGNNDV